MKRNILHTALYLLAILAIGFVWITPASAEAEATLETKVAKLTVSAESTDFSANNDLGFDIKKEFSAGLGGLVQRSRNTFAREYKVNLIIKDSSSQEVYRKEVDIKQDIENIDFSDVSLSPGEYTFLIEDQNADRVLTQNFSWGVLAINTDKPVYAPGETAEIAMAVLDETGMMACGADVSLTIKDPNGNEQNFKTSDQTINIGEDCQLKAFIEEPDFWTSYKTSATGRYSMTLTAVTANGTHQIVDAFEVKNDMKFDIKRSTATRIYPYLEYPVVIEVTPQQDYKGLVTERFPRKAQVFYLNSDELKTQFGKDYDLENGLVETPYALIEDEEKVMRWQVDWRAGETYYIAYKYDAADVSPDYYILPGLEIGDFSEARSWQVAVDAIGLENSNVNTITGATSGSVSLTVTSASLVVVVVGTAGGTTATVSDTTDGSYTQAQANGSTGDPPYSAIFYLNNPTAESKTINVSLGATGNANLQAFGLTGTNTTTPIGNTAGTTGAGTSASNAITTANNNSWIISAFSYADNGTVNSYGTDQNQIQQQNNNLGGNKISTASTYELKATAGSDTQSTSWSKSSNWAMNSVEVRIEVVTMTGIAYTDEGTTPDTTASICVAVNAGTPACDATDGSGEFVITPSSVPNSGDQLTFFFDGGTEFGNTVTTSDGSAISTGDNLKVFQGHVIVRDDNASSATIVKMDAYDNDQNATDMLFDAEDLATDTLTVEDGYELYVPSGHTFAPGGNLTAIDDLKVVGTYTASTGETITVSGSYACSGTFTPSTAVMTFDATTGTETLNSTCTNPATTFNDSAGSATFQATSTLNFDGNLTITGGNFDANSNNISVAGNWDNDDTFTSGTQTTTFDATSGTNTIDADGTGTDSFSSLVFNDGGGTATYQLTTVADVNGSLTITGGNFDANSNNINIAGSWANNDTFTSGNQTTTFDATSGTISIDGTGTGTSSFSTLTLNDSAGSATFQLTSALDVNGAFNITDGVFSMNGANNINTAGAVTIGSGASYTKGTGTWTHDGTYTLTDSSSGGPQNLGTTVIDGTTNTVTLGSNVLMDSLQVATGDTFAMATYNVGVGATGSTNSGGINIAGSTSQTSGTVTVISSASGTATFQGAGTLTAANLTIGDAVTTFSVDNETNDLAIDLSGTFSILANATFSASSTASFAVAGSWSNAGTFTDNSGSVTLNATTGTPNITSGGSPFNNLVLDDTANGITWTLQDALNVDTLLTITGGTLDTGTNQSVNLDSLTNNDTFTTNSSTVTFDEAGGSIAGTSNTSFYTLSIDPATTGTVTLTASNPTVTNSLSVASGDTFSLSTSRTVTMPSGSSMTLDGTISGAGRIYYYSATAFPSSGTFSVDIYFYLDDTDMTITSRTYGADLNLYNFSDFDRTATLGAGTLNIGGNLSTSTSGFSGALYIEGSVNNPTVNITGDLDLPTILAPARYLITGSGTWTVTGNFLVFTGGTLTATSGNTIIMNGTGKTITTAGQALQNFEVQGTISNADDLNVDGTFTVTSGTFTQLDSANVDISVAGNFTIGASGAWSAPTTNTDANLIFDGDLAFADNAGSQNVGFVVIGTSPDTTNLTTDFTANSLTITSADIFNTCEYDLDIGNSDLTVDGTLDTSATGTNISCASTGGNEGDETTMNVASSFTVSGTGTVVQDQSTLIMDNPSGTDTITLDGESLYNLTASPGGTTQFADTIIIDNDLLITTGTLDLNSQTITIGGNFDNDAAMLDGTSSVTFTADSDGSVTIDADGTGDEAFYDVIFNGTGDTFQLTTLLDVNNDFTITAGTFDANGQNMNIQGSYSNSGTFTSNSNLVTFDDTDGGETLAGTMTGSSSFYDVTFNDGGATGAWSFGANSATVTNNFTISGGTVTAPSTTLTIGQNFSNSDSFANNSGTVVFNDAGKTSLLTYTATTSFNNFTVATASKAMEFETSAGVVTDINGAFTVNGGSCTTYVSLSPDSATPTNDWEIDVTGATVNVDYADVTYSTANTTSITAENSANGGNNTNWTINLGACAPKDVRLFDGGRLYGGVRMKP